VKSLRLDSHSSAETRLLGNCLGKLAQKADIFLLTGELGVGKTCLVQGIASGLNVKEHAFSPSFVILREYHGRLPLYHIDFYRLDDVEEIAGLGLEEYFQGEGVCVIEWAEKGLQVIPEENLLIKIRYTSASQTQRSFHFKPHGPRYSELIEQLQKREEIVALDTKC
jgi:tRNA threonylcarbamoyladenosine biosynthesis protein TsaE